MIQMFYADTYANWNLLFTIQVTVYLEQCTWTGACSFGITVNKMQEVCCEFISTALSDHLGEDWGFTKHISYK
jgi:hypothetical protein